MRKDAREFQIFVKPAGADCNLDCRYCYYKNKSGLYPTGPFRMPEDLLEQYIVQHIEAAAGPVVDFSWHGGEPTIHGLDFFRKVTDLQHKHKPAGWRIRNGIQTNGILLNEEWAQFLAEEDFHVGLSIDGPTALHDSCRITRGGEPTHAKVMHTYELLKTKQIRTDILCVVHALNVRHPLAVYRFFRSIGVQNLAFLPVVEQARGNGASVSPETPSAEDYGAFLCRIFDEWIARDVGRIMVQLFDEAARPAMGLEHSMCMYRETCGQIPVMEHNGDFYSCDHYVDIAHCAGNIREIPLHQLLDSESQRSFGSAKKDTLPRYCRECDVLAQCNGGCPKYRILNTPDGEPGLHYLCAGLKQFFRHSRDPLVRLIERQRGPAPRLHLNSLTKAGRNDPCPCGSGRKYKKCCGVE